MTLHVRHSRKTGTGVDDGKNRFVLDASSQRLARSGPSSGERNMTRRELLMQVVVMPLLATRAPKVVWTDISEIADGSLYAHAGDIIFNWNDVPPVVLNVHWNGKVAR